LRCLDPTAHAVDGDIDLVGDVVALPDLDHERVGLALGPPAVIRRDVQVQTSPG